MYLCIYVFMCVCIRVHRYVSLRLSVSLTYFFWVSPYLLEHTHLFVAHLSLDSNPCVTMVTTHVGVHVHVYCTQQQ